MRRRVREAWIIVSLILAACYGGVAEPDIKVTAPDTDDILGRVVPYSITGTEGKRWKGVESITRTGTVPYSSALFVTKGKTVRVTIQKDEPGAWTLTLCVEGVCRTTTAEFGIVTVEVTG